MKSFNRQKSISGMAPSYLLGGKMGSAACVILATFLLVLGLVNPQAITGIRVGASDTFTPVLSFFTKPFTSLSNTIGSVSGMAELRAENAQLKTENVRLKEWYQTALMLQAENHSLQDLLNLKIDPAFKYITTRVISDAGNAFVKTVLISAGSQDGIQKNQAVLSGEGMIGRVIEVGNQSARVLLLTDINSRIPVLIEDSSQKAIMAGNNNDAPILKHLPQDAGINKNARVVTSGHGGVFPPGLPIGRITEASSGKYPVTLYADTDKIVYVRVVDTTYNKNLILNETNNFPQMY